jgi:pseudouridine-5'-phosphate glycosidase
VVANPIPAADELDRQLHDRTLAAGLAALAEAGVHGKAVTPFLLADLQQRLGPAAVAANVALVASNAALAARIALALAR